MRSTGQVRVHGLNVRAQAGGSLLQVFLAIAAWFHLAPQQGLFENDSYG